jgi:HD-GYP domain-containing protein (c-di-GMP phosphodiesterase class II)
MDPFGELKIILSLEHELEKGDLGKFLTRACAIARSFLEVPIVVILLKRGPSLEVGASAGVRKTADSLALLAEVRLAQTALASNRLITSRQPLRVGKLFVGYAAAAPLHVTQPMGVVAAASGNDSPLTKRQKEGLKALANLLSRFLFCWTVRKATSDRSLPQVMLRLSESIISSKEIDKALSFVLEHISSLYPEAFVDLRLLNGELLKIKVSHGPPSWADFQRDFRIGEGTAGLTARERQTVYIEDVSKDPRYVKLPGEPRGSVKSYLGIPLIFQDRLMGVMDLIFPQKTELTREELAFLEIAGHMVSSSLQAFFSREEAVREQQELRRTLYGSITALSQAVEAKDTYTSNHLQDVSQITQKIGLKMGLSEEELEDLYLAAVLHDIGKIGIPDSVLRKPDKLTFEEWQIMKQHPIIGERILSNIPKMSSAAKLVRWHHERWDGKGYPDGLKGEEIPLSARILAVVDAYSAMREKRPYRDGLSKEEAIAELKKNSGTQFDPRVVEVFLSLYDFQEEH